MDLIKEELAADGKLSGVEAEGYRPYPFDANKISIQRKILPLNTLVRRLENNMLVAAEMQRGIVWDKGRKSRLIESILLKIPLPLFYAAADKNDVFYIVDGLQRVNTIREFVLEKSLALSGLEFLRELKGKTYNELSTDLQIRIEETELQFAVIQPDSPPEVQRNIFKRLNTGGLPLSDQEIRHALYYGHVSGYLKQFAMSQEFQKATTESINDSRMAAQELALRFIAFTVMGKESYRKDEEMDSFLCDAMQIVNALSIESPLRIEKRFIQIDDLDEIKHRFLLSMRRAEQLFKRCAFRMAIQSRNPPWRPPINKSLFEVWSVILSTMAESNFQILLDRRDLLDDRLEEIYDATHPFRKYCGTDSTKVSGIRGRYMEINEMIQSILESCK